jgi:hypothetical protein
MDDESQSFPPLEERCSNCRGTGQMSSRRFENGYGPCSDCQGQGTIPTEFGLAVQAFVEKSFMRELEVVLKPKRRDE